MIYVYPGGALSIKAKLVKTSHCRPHLEYIQMIFFMVTWSSWSTPDPIKETSRCRVSSRSGRRRCFVWPLLIPRTSRSNSQIKTGDVRRETAFGAHHTRETDWAWHLYSFRFCVAPLLPPCIMANSHNYPLSATDISRLHRTWITLYRDITLLIGEDVDWAPAGATRAMYFYCT